MTFAFRFPAVLLAGSIACGGTTIDLGPGPSRGADADGGVSPASDASTTTDGSISSSCVIGAACTGKVACRPCTDVCNDTCNPLACVNGWWGAMGAPPPPPRCKPPPPGDAGSAVCAIPPVDVTHCQNNSDCAMVFDQCYCGAQPVFAVNKLYAQGVQACEDDKGKVCALACPVMPAYQPTQGNQTTQDLSRIVVECGGNGVAPACITHL